MAALSDEVVQAAGGIVWRLSDNGAEVLLVHRPKYDDWSFPKGKLDPGETLEAAALREVAEETGLRCELGERVGSVSYRDQRGRDKLSTYWAMRPLGGRFTAHDEVDEVSWLPVGRALDRLSYDHDRELLAGWAALTTD